MAPQRQVNMGRRAVTLVSNNATEITANNALNNNSYNINYNEIQMNSLRSAANTVKINNNSNHIDE